MANSLLEIQDLAFSFSQERVLGNITFSIQPSEIVSIVGPSGCGKTLLLRILSGLAPSQTGRIAWNKNESPCNIGMAFQSNTLFPWLTLDENLTICMSSDKLSKPEREKLSNQMLESAGLARYKNHLPSEVSGGMAQKVNVLRAFAPQPEVVFMDEPFVHLDYFQRAELQDFTLRVWAKTRPSILFVSHDIDEALLLSDRIIVLTHKPTQVATIIDVQFPRPRTARDIRRLPQYTDHYERILNLLSPRLHDRSPNA
jgi:NitT/TauT family transport system ATP-binding protein